jgi:hypothetical protein
MIEVNFNFEGFTIYNALMPVVPREGEIVSIPKRDGSRMKYKVNSVTYYLINEEHQRTSFADLIISEAK